MKRVVALAHIVTADLDEPSGVERVVALARITTADLDEPSGVENYVPGSSIKIRADGD